MMDSASPRPVLMVVGLNAFHTMVSQMLVAINNEILQVNSMRENSINHSIQKFCWTTMNADATHKREENDAKILTLIPIHNLFAAIHRGARQWAQHRRAAANARATTVSCRNILPKLAEQSALTWMMMIAQMPAPSSLGSPYMPVIT